MKKIFKNPFLTFILGAIVFSGITVAAYTITSNDVGYTPSDNTWEVDNVRDAIDYLYNQILQKPKIINLITNTDNYVKPSAASYNHTFTNNGTVIVDIAAADGNNQLINNWDYSVKKNNISIEKTDGYSNGYNGHYYWIFNVKKDDNISISTSVSYNNVNYNTISLSVYFVDY